MNAILLGKLPKGKERKRNSKKIKWKKCVIGQLQKVVTN